MKCLQIIPGYLLILTLCSFASFAHSLDTDSRVLRSFEPLDNEGGLGDTSV